MSSERFVPMSKRGDPDEARQFSDTLHEGIPGHLLSSADEFLHEVLVTERDFRDVELRMQVRVEYHYLSTGGFWRDETLREFVSAYISSPEEILDLLDERLRSIEVGPDFTDGRAERFARSLTLGGSAWMVGLDNGRYCLQRRVDETTIAAFGEAAQHGKSGEHLHLAWSALYGRSPQPLTAYLEAVRAVEVAAAPIVTPRDGQAELGKIVGALRNAPTGKFEVVLRGKYESSDSVNLVKLMAQLLHTHEYRRHGDPDPEAPITINADEATAAVHLAVLLVQWFESGTIRRA